MCLLFYPPAPLFLFSLVDDREGNGFREAHVCECMCVYLGPWPRGWEWAGRFFLFVFACFGGSTLYDTEVVCVSAGVSG